MKRGQFPVEARDFMKPSWSKNNPKTCVTVAIKPEGVAVRDSKNPEGGTQFYSHDEWDAFVKSVKDGQFDPIR